VVPDIPSTSLGISATSASPMLSYMLQQYQVHFQKLVLKKSGDDEDENTFGLVMFVRIVSEICNELHIPCRRGISVHVKNAARNGNGRISIADVVEGFKHGLKPYRSPYTFRNYCTIKLNAETLLDHMETECECEMPKTRFMTRAKELLQTTFNDAIKLTASRYGKIKDFELTVKELSVKHQLVMPKEEDY
jgi:hypothetical protein